MARCRSEVPYELRMEDRGWRRETKAKRAVLFSGRPFEFKFRSRLRLDEGRAGLGLKRVFGGIGQLTECRGIGRSDVGDDLAVQGTLGGLQSFDEAAVGEANRAGG